jgi:hypothetical protein
MRLTAAEGSGVSPPSRTSLLVADVGSPEVAQKALEGGEETAPQAHDIEFVEGAFGQPVSGRIGTRRPARRPRAARCAAPCVHPGTVAPGGDRRIPILGDQEPPA